VVIVLGGLLTGGYLVLVLMRALSPAAAPLAMAKPVARSREVIALALSMSALLLGMLALGPLELPPLIGSGVMPVAGP
jgi:hypothetical protein